LKIALDTHSFYRYQISVKQTINLLDRFLREIRKRPSTAKTVAGLADGLKGAPKGFQPFETLFFSYRICPCKATRKSILYERR
jgi:hypothetical protein